MDSKKKIKKKEYLYTGPENFRNNKKFSVE